MKKLIKAEFYKLQNLPFFRMIILFTFAIGILRGFSSSSGYQVYTMSLFPELFDAILISVFTAVFLCMEFSNRTFGNIFLCGTSRQNVFFAKLVVYFSGLLILVLIPLVASTVVATMRNGIGMDWDAVALEMAIKLLFYILHRFSMAGFAILVAVVVQNPVGTLGISVVGILESIPHYLQYYNLDALRFAVGVLIVFIIKAVILLSVAEFIFVRRDLR